MHPQDGCRLLSIQPESPKRENGIVCSGERESFLKNVIEEFS